MKSAAELLAEASSPGLGSVEWGPWGGDGTDKLSLDETSREVLTPRGELTEPHVDSSPDSDTVDNILFAIASW